MNTLTQGSLIYGLRSPKYSRCKCFGVIISARCDIAQRKTPSIHMLTAVDLKDWIHEEVFYLAVDQELSSNKKII